jgi:hypothetical protein
MPFKGRFSRMFLKKEERLPSSIKQKVVKTISEMLVNLYIGISLVVL